MTDSGLDPICAAAARQSALDRGSGRARRGRTRRQADDRRRAVDHPPWPVDRGWPEPLADQRRTALAAGRDPQPGAGRRGRQEQSGRLLAIRSGERRRARARAAGHGPAAAHRAVRRSRRVTGRRRAPACGRRPARGSSARAGRPPRRAAGAGRLSAAGGAATDARAAAAEGAPPGQQGPGTPGQPSAQTGAALAAEVVGRDASGRLLLRAAGLTLRLEAVLDLPAGARLQLILPPGLATSSLPALDDDPLRG